MTANRLYRDITTGPTFTTVTRVTVVNVGPVDITTGPTFTTVPRVTVVNVGPVVMSPFNTVIHNDLRINVTL